MNDVPELLFSEVGEAFRQLVANLPIGVFRETDAARLADRLQPRRDVDAVPHQVAVGLFDDVAEVNANPHHQRRLDGEAGVAFGKRVLDFDRGTRRFNHAAVLGDHAVAGALDDAAVMGGDGRVDEVAAQSTKTLERALLVLARHPAEADDVGDQDRGELSSLAHNEFRSPQPLADARPLASAAARARHCSWWLAIVGCGASPQVVRTHDYGRRAAYLALSVRLQRGAPRRCLVGPGITPKNSSRTRMTPSRFGFFILNDCPIRSSTKSSSEPRISSREAGSTTTVAPSRLKTRSSSAKAFGFDLRAGRRLSL